MSSVKEIAKVVRKELKKAFPEYKFSVTTSTFSGGQEMTVALMSGPDNPFDGDKTYCILDTQYHQGGYAQLNHIHIKQVGYDNKWVSNGYMLTQKAAQMLKKVTRIANRENWNNSDIMSDYFDVNYYFELAIGKWNKDYIIKE